MDSQDFSRTAEGSLTFSLISSTQLRTGSKRNKDLNRKHHSKLFLSVVYVFLCEGMSSRYLWFWGKNIVLVLSPWLRWTQTGGGGMRLYGGCVEDVLGVSVRSSSLSSSTDSSEFSSSSSSYVSSAGEESKNDPFSSARRGKRSHLWLRMKNVK